MNTIETIKLDRVPKGKMPVLHASQYDNGRTHGIDLTNLGEEWKLDGTETLTINERKVDNNICSMDIENTFVGSSHIEFASFLQMCACAGSNFCELRISKGDVDLGTLNFILEVEPDPTADGIESESEIRNLKTQVEAITEEVIGEDYYNKTQTDDLLAAKADETDLQALSSVVDTKANTSDVNDALALKADKSTTYTKTEVDTALSAKADTSAVNIALALKADKSDTYTKAQVDNSLNAKMDKVNPTGTGSLSINRKSGSVVGNNSMALGYNVVASASYSFAEGDNTVSSAQASHAEGYATETSARFAHAEGRGTVASAENAHAEGYSSTASGGNSHAEGNGTTASGGNSHAEGNGTTASGSVAHAEGRGTVANHRSQHVFGEFNTPDDSTAQSTAKGNYVEIVGNGASDNARSNARTLGWDGTETLAGDLIFNGSTSLATALNNKADKSDTYTKAQVDAIVEAAIDSVLPTDSVSGAVANFKTSLAKPLISIDVDNSATKIYQLGGNFFNKNAVTSGKMINGSGNEVSYANWNLSDYIPVIEGSKYYIYGLTVHPNTNQDNFELFDASKTKVGYANVKTNEQPYTIPSGVKYIKCCVKDPDIDTAQLGVAVNSGYSAYDSTINEFDIGDTITTIIGFNNIFADNGDVSVSFKCTVEDYVNAHSGGGLRSLGNSNENLSKGGDDSEEEPKEDEKDPIEPISKK